MNNLYIQALINNINSGISVSSQLNAMNTVFLKSDYETKVAVAEICVNHAKKNGFSAPANIISFQNEVLEKAKAEAEAAEKAKAEAEAAEKAKAEAEAEAAEKAKAEAELETNEIELPSFNNDTYTNDVMLSVLEQLEASAVSSDSEFTIELPLFNNATYINDVMFASHQQLQSLNSTEVKDAPVRGFSFETKAGDFEPLPVVEQDFCPVLNGTIEG